MSALTFTLRGPPPERLDCSPLTPRNLSRASLIEIERLVVGTGRQPSRVGDVFDLRDGERDRIVFAGGAERLDFIGANLEDGAIVVDGDVGGYAARLMTAGRIDIRGACGPFAASRMRGGVLRIDGDCGDDLGGTMPGETQGMAGGIVDVDGAAGARAGNRMRRGVVIVRGATGPHAGARMIGGTIIARGGFGAEPGPLMRRGTLIGPAAGALLPTFVDCGAHELLFLTILARSLAGIEGLAPFSLPHRVRRMAGDMATLGKGELLLPL